MKIENKLLLNRIISEHFLFLKGASASLSIKPSTKAKDLTNKSTILPLCSCLGSKFGYNCYSQYIK